MVLLANPWNPTKPDAMLVLASEADATSSPTPHPRVPLRSLRTVELLPEWRSDVPNVSSSLLTIDQIHVVRSNTPGPGGYAIQIFCEALKSRIPTNRTSHNATRRATPPCHGRLPLRSLKRTVRQFAALRDTVHGCVQTCACSFCASLSSFLTFGRGRPMAFARLAFHPDDDASELFERLLTEALDQCRTVLTGARRGSCRGQRHVPFLLHTFLQPS